MRVEVVAATSLRFVDGSPVRAASGLARLGGDWLVVQDDATHACLWHDGAGRRLRVLPPVEGHDVFGESSGTKALKPDLESAAELPGQDAVLLLGSGSTEARTRSALVGHDSVAVADLAPLYARVAELLDLPMDHLNLEGACVIGETMLWFQRGLPAAGVPTASVRIPVRSVLDAAAGGDPDPGVVSSPVRYDLGEAAGRALAITDAVTLGEDLLLVSAAAEDSPTTYDDGPVVASALALLGGDHVLDVVELPRLDGRVVKLEGIAVQARTHAGLTLVAVVDADDPTVPSTMLELRVSSARRAPRPSPA